MMIVSRDVLGFSTTSKMRRIIDINGFYVSIMRADKKSDDDGSLPPGIPIPCLPVDYLKDRPDFWIDGQGSYVCPIESDWALWFNFTMNRRDISILTSVKGMNPMTGQRINGLELEQYVERCPVHNIVFKHGRYCSSCNFKWPNQNYLTDPNPFYLDGFRSADGIVRQFYFTEDMAKSVPEQVIGKDDTVPAFGFCFYNLKKQTETYEDGNRLKNKFPESFTLAQPRRVKTSLFDVDSVKDISKSMLRSKMGGPISPPTKCCSDSVGIGSSSPDLLSGFSADYERCRDIVSVNDIDRPISPPLLFDRIVEKRTRSLSAEVGIGAGAKIKQRFEKDRHLIEEWRSKPSGIIRIYFVFREQFEKYVSEGLHDLVGHEEGYLEGIQVGGTK